MAQGDGEGKREYSSGVARIVKEETTLKGIVHGLQAETSILERIWKIELAAGGALMLAAAVAWFFGHAWLFAAPGVVLSFLGVAHAQKRGDNRADVGRFQGGAEGEREVTRILQSGLPDSYIILNDCSVRSGARSAQNDHIVLGPNGVFVVETKAYSGTLQGAATDEYLRQTKTFDGKTTETRIKNPIPQNAYHIEILAAAMKTAGFVTDDIHSVIVFTNRWTRLEISGANVPVVRPGELAAAILGREPTFAYDEEWIRRLALFLEPSAKF